MDDSTPGRTSPIGPHPPAEVEAIAEAEMAHAPADRPKAPASPWRDRFTTVSAVSGGGLLGTTARYLVGVWATDRWGGAFPWGTFLVNVTGSFVIGFYLTLVTERLAGRAATRLFLATGFLGAYTTFSTFAYETARFVQEGEPLRASVYVGASLVCGLAAVVAGIATAHAL